MFIVDRIQLLKKTKIYPLPNTQRSHTIITKLPRVKKMYLIKQDTSLDQVKFTETENTLGKTFCHVSQLIWKTTVKKKRDNLKRKKQKNQQSGINNLATMELNAFKVCRHYIEKVSQLFYIQVDLANKLYGNLQKNWVLV